MKNRFPSLIGQRFGLENPKSKHFVYCMESRRFVVKVVSMPNSCPCALERGKRKVMQMLVTRWPHWVAAVLVVLELRLHQLVAQLLAGPAVPADPGVS